MAELLHVEKRKSFGKRNNERLRRAGKLPAVLYGHGEEAGQPDARRRPVRGLAPPRREGRRPRRRRQRQGAAAGRAVGHVFPAGAARRFAPRAGRREGARSKCRSSSRGEAPGVRDGGIIEQLIHSIEIEVALDVIPEKLHINIKNLQIGGHLTAKDIIDLPAGATILVDEDEMIVHCVMPVDRRGRSRSRRRRRRRRAGSHRQGQGRGRGRRRGEGVSTEQGARSMALEFGSTPCSRAPCSPLL